MQLYDVESAEVYVFDTFPNAEKIVYRLQQTGVFENVYFIKDKENFSTGKAASLKSIFKKSFLNAMLDGKVYEEVFLFNIFALSNDVAVNKIKKSNKSCIINIVEDGPSLYDVHLRDGFTQKILYPLLGIYTPSKCIDYWWFSIPERMCPPNGGKKKKIPKVDRNIPHMVDTINCTFDYKDNKILKNADILFMEECFWSDGLLKDSFDLEIFECIKNKFSSIRTCVKLHPRTKVNRFSENFDVIEANGIPWEVYALNMDMSSKIMVSLLCATMTSTKFLYGEETFSLLLYPLFVDKIFDVKTGKRHLTNDLVSQVSNQIELYDDKSKFVVADSMDEAYKTIDEWLKRLNK